jgi:hypothetical protein
LIDIKRLFASEKVKEDKANITKIPTPNLGLGLGRYVYQADAVASFKID